MLNKKWLCLILSFSLIFPTLVSIPVSSVYADVNQSMLSSLVPEDVRGTSCETAVRTLLGLKLIEGDIKESFEPDNNITKAEFVSIIIRILGLENTAADVPANTVFNDVKSDYWAANSIKEAVDIGIISRNPENIFGPDDNITFKQACKILVSALGYDLYAKKSGGYPTGYLTIAVQKDVTKNIGKTLGSNVTKSDAAIMLYNALTVDIMQKDSFGKEDGYTITTGKTLLSEKLNIYKEFGQITENADTAINADSNIAKDEVLINGTKFKTGDSTAQIWLGYIVDYYYKIDKDNGNKIILYSEPKGGYNNVLTIPAENINSYSNHKYSYWVDKDKDLNASDVSLSDKFDIIYNGRALTVYDDNKLKPAAGNVVLLDTDNDGMYDIVFETSLTNYVVQSISDNVVYDKYDKNKNVNLDPNDSNIEVNITDKDGKKIKLSDIKEWDILTIAESHSISGGKVSYIITYTSKTFDGQISEIDNGSQNEERKITVGGEPYTFAYSYPDSEFQNLKISDDRTYYLDAQGKIAAVKTKSKDAKFAYLIMAALKNSLDGRVQVKLYTEDGDFVVLDCAEKVNIYGENVKGQDIINALSLNKLLLYQLNDNGEISTIDTSVDRTSSLNEEKLNDISCPSTQTLHYKWTPMSFGGVANINTKTIVFVIPMDPNKYAPGTLDEDSFAIKDKGYFAEDGGYSIDAYYKTHDGLEADAVVVHDDSATSISSGAPVAFVEKVTKSISEDGQNLYKVYLYDNGVLRNYFVKSNVLINSQDIADVLKEGDGVRYSLDPKSQITNLVKVFDVNSRQICKSGNTTTDSFDGGVNFYDKYMELFGYVYLKTNNVIQIKVNGFKNSMSTDSDLINYRFNGTEIYVYDTNMPEGRRLSLGSSNDIIDYCHSNSYSRVFVNATDAIPNSILIIK